MAPASVPSDTWSGCFELARRVSAPGSELVCTAQWKGIDCLDIASCILPVPKVDQGEVNEAYARHALPEKKKMLEASWHL